LGKGKMFFNRFLRRSDRKVTAVTEQHPNAGQPLRRFFPRGGQMLETHDPKGLRWGYDTLAARFPKANGRDGPSPINRFRFDHLTLRQTCSATCIHMKKRKLGNSGIEVSPLAFGGNVFGWTVDESTSFTLLDAFAAAGFNLIDTADVYSRWVSGHTGGESESIIGKWLKRSGNRAKVVIATKVGRKWGRGRDSQEPIFCGRWRIHFSACRRITLIVPVPCRRSGYPLEETHEAYAD
jgi:hypothetical protein